MTTQNSGISRRTLVKGTAWAVPAITVASAIPGFAAASTCLDFSIDNATACKWPGQSQSISFGYHFQLCVKSTCTNVTQVTITELSVSGGSGKTLVPCDFTFPYTINLDSAGNGCLPVSNYKGDASGNFITVKGYQGAAQTTILALGKFAAPTQDCTNITQTCQ